MVKLLITGGAGFVGSNLAKLASMLGHEVVIYDDLSIGNTEYIQELSVQLIQGDIREISEKIPGSYRPDYVCHLAAAGNVIQSIENPKSNLDINVTGTLAVLEFCRSVRAKRLLFSSTGGALMGNAVPPVDENSTPKPISPYGASKLACEGYINAYRHCYGLDFTIFRFGNVLGENCLHKVGVINKFFEQLKNGKELSVFGNVSRDFIYVQDLTRAILNAIDNENAVNNIFHLASGHEVYISEVAKMVLDEMRINNATINIVEKRMGEVERNFADISKAKKILDLQNSISTETLIKQTVSYLRQNDENNSTGMYL